MDQGQKIKCPEMGPVIQIDDQRFEGEIYMEPHCPPGDGYAWMWRAHLSVNSHILVTVKVLMKFRVENTEICFCSHYQ